MKRILTFILTFIVMILGALIIFSNPIDPLAIVIGMLLVSISILNLAVQIYFPSTPEQTVELKVEEPDEISESKASEKIGNPKKTVENKKKR